MATYYSPDNYRTRWTADDVRGLQGEEAERLAKHWDALACVMDFETRERVHSELAPCTREEFLARYLELASEPLAVVGGRYKVRRGHPGAPGVHAPPER